jgi:hypothetical protein
MDKHRNHNDANDTPDDPATNPKPATDKLGDEFARFADETLAWAEQALALPFFCVTCETTHPFGLCPADHWD